MKDFTSVSKVLAMAPVVAHSKLEHPLDWAKSQFGSHRQVAVLGQNAVIIEAETLYYSLGSISASACIQYIPVPGRICVGNMAFSVPSVLSIESLPIDTVELVVKYKVDSNE